MLQFFAPITKVHESSRKIEGILALEVVDKDGEIMDYSASKPYFEKWSKEVHKNSGGKSVGNLREMHTRKAAGKFTALTFNDDLKRIEFEAEVVDDDSWKKVESGVLNGVSIGGDLIKKWKDPLLKAKRYIVNPCEGSLVDNPNMYGATFEVVKVDGASEVRKFKGSLEVSQVWTCVNDESHRHPTKSEAVHCEGSSDVEKDVDDELHFKNDDTKVEKSLYDVSSLAGSLQSLKYLTPGDKNKPKFKKALLGLASVLADMAKDEKELIKTDDSVLKTKEGDSVMKKVEKDKKKEAEEVDEEEESQEVDSSDDSAEDEENSDESSNVEKMVTGALTKFFKGNTLQKMIGKTIKTEIDEALTEVREDIEALGSAITGFGKKPVPTKAVTKVVDSKNRAESEAPKKSKNQTILDEAPKKTSDRNELVEVMKMAQKNPIFIKNDEDNDEETEEGDEE